MTVPCNSGKNRIEGQNCYHFWGMAASFNQASATKQEMPLATTPNTANHQPNSTLESLIAPTSTPACCNP